MAVRYNKLFKIMVDEKMNAAQLAKQAGVSANVMTKLKRDQYVALESIEKICATLSCKVDDILEFTQENDK